MKHTTALVAVDLQEQEKHEHFCKWTQDGYYTWNTRVYRGIHVYYTYIIRPVFTGLQVELHNYTL